MRHLNIAKKLFPFAKIAVLRHQKYVEKPEHTDFQFSEMNEALSFSPQIAVICNPAPFHIHIAQELAENGAHLFIEKPISNKSQGVDRLIKICEQHRLILHVGYNLRYFKSLQYFRSSLQNKIIGEIFSVRSEVGQYLPLWRKNKDYRDGVSAKRNLGGGVLLELSHEIDYLRWVFGDIYWVQAILAKQSNLEVDVEDTAHIIFGFNASNRNKQLIASVNLDFIRHDTTRLCRAIGETGTLEWNCINDSVSIYKPKQNKWEILFACKNKSNDSYLEEWKGFIKALNGNKENIVDGEDGLKTLYVAEAARLSSQNNGIKTLIKI